VTQVAIIGAGPYGLSIAAHLRSLDVSYRIFGTPMDSWLHHMPAGMALKSDGFASSLIDPDGEGTLAAYCVTRDIPYHDTDIPVPLDVFTSYALDFQQRFVPDIEERQVTLLESSVSGFSLTLDDGEVIRAESVVAAIGITHFGYVPAELANLPRELVSHSSAHHDLSSLSGRDVTVIGGGSSAVDLAVLAHEAGATTSLMTRRDSVRFDSEPDPGPKSKWQRLRRPSSGLGPGWRSWLCENAPNLFRFAPRGARIAIIRRHLGPRSAWHMKARLESGVGVSLGESIDRAAAEDGRVRLVLRSADGTRRTVLTDHVVCATGYRPDIHRLEFLGANVRESIRTEADVPVLSQRFESSVPGLYFVGLPAVNSFGPLMRFMVGAKYAAPIVAERLARSTRHASEPASTMAPA
jgi:cation diffusion facilitator CzcD-associated flavoprotein CzcO